MPVFQSKGYASFDLHRQECNESKREYINLVRSESADEKTALHNHLCRQSEFTDLLICPWLKDIWSELIQNNDCIHRELDPVCDKPLSHNLGRMYCSCSKNSENKCGSSSCRFSPSPDRDCASCNLCDGRSCYCEIASHGYLQCDALLSLWKQ